MMEKIVIIGSSGAGKTTLARELGFLLKIKVFHLDRLFWRRGWKRKTRDTRTDILQNLVLRDKRWIIEGTYLNSSKQHLNAADTIIFLDISPLLCFQRLIKRHREYYKRSRRDIPEGCTDKLTLLRIVKVLTFPLHGRRTIKQKLRKYNSKQIIWLHSTKEVEDFLAQEETNVDAKRTSSSSVPATKEKPYEATVQKPGFSSHGSITCLRKSMTRLKVLFASLIHDHQVISNQFHCYYNDKSGTEFIIQSESAITVSE